MTGRTARADVPELRQETQFTCCATSIAACLRAHGKDQTEADVNKVLGAAPLRGATWESILATVQYFGLRGRLVVPATVEMMKEWTDAKLPVLISWTPRDRPWAHASVVFDVTGDAPGSRSVHVMDPNLPNPSKSVIVLPEDEFYVKWFEKADETMYVRRPACVVEREVSSEGRQMTASVKVSQGIRMIKTASEIYVDANGIAYDDEGNRANVGTSFPQGTYFPRDRVYDRLSQAMSRLEVPDRRPARRLYPEMAAFYEKWALLAELRGDEFVARFLTSIAGQVRIRGFVTERQEVVLARMRRRYGDDLNHLDEEIELMRVGPNDANSRLASIRRVTARYLGTSAS